jgi:hypothetical protein
MSHTRDTAPYRLWFKARDPSAYTQTKLVNMNATSAEEAERVGRELGEGMLRKQWEFVKVDSIGIPDFRPIKREG